MAKDLSPGQLLVNDSRREAARWLYKIIQIDAHAEVPGRGALFGRSAQSSLNQFAAEGWEPCMMSDTAILMRRDATGAVHEDEDQKRDQLLKAAANMAK